MINGLKKVGLVLSNFREKILIYVTYLLAQQYENLSIWFIFKNQDTFQKNEWMYPAKVESLGCNYIPWGNGNYLNFKLRKKKGYEKLQIDTWDVQYTYCQDCAHNPQIVYMSELSDSGSTDK